MKIHFANNKLARQMENATAIKKSFGVMAKKVSMRLDDIAAAANLTILKQLPQAGCHQLKLDRAGEWSVSISGNYRIIFVLDHDPIPLKEDGSIDEIIITNVVITSVEDYH